MSALKFWTNLCLVVIFTSHFVVMNVDGIPVKKKPTKILRKPIPSTTTTKFFPKPIDPTKKPSTRDPRFLGKLSFVAGLNLPNPPTTSPTNRKNYVYEQQGPSQYVTTYNFPSSRWGPYVAAVYEPLPVPSFFDDPFGYLAAILNPYNWFNNGVVTSNIPAFLTTAAPSKKPDEVFLIVHDSDEERMSFTDRAETKIGQESIDEQKHSTKLAPFESSTTTRDFTTEPYEEDSDMDLIAEETTIKQIENNEIDKSFEADSRQFRRTTTHRARATERTTRPTTTETQTYATEKVTLPNRRPNITTTTIRTTSESNSTMAVTTSTVNTTTPTLYPLQNATYPSHHNGYYYGGHPQNVSHIELTTKKVPTIDSRIESFNDVNQYLQPYQPNYNDYYEPQNLQMFDFFRNSEQLPPLPNNYYDRNSVGEPTFNNMNDDDLNGFKPSFPIHF